MEIKILFLLLLSSLLFINCVFHNGHQLPYSFHDHLAQGHEDWFSFHAMPRKLMINTKVVSVADKDFVSYNDDLSGESHKGGGEAPTTTTSKVSMQSSYPTHMFTMDYSPVRRRRPVHNKALPTTTTSP